MTIGRYRGSCPAPPLFPASACDRPGASASSPAGITPDAKTIQKLGQVQLSAPVSTAGNAIIDQFDDNRELLTQRHRLSLRGHFLTGAVSSHAHAYSQPLLIGVLFSAFTF